MGAPLFLSVMDVCFIYLPSFPLRFSTVRFSNFWCAKCLLVSHHKSFVTFLTSVEIQLHSFRCCRSFSSTEAVIKIKNNFIIAFPYPYFVCAKPCLRKFELRISTLQIGYSVFLCPIYKICINSKSGRCTIFSLGCLVSVHSGTRTLNICFSRLSAHQLTKSVYVFSVPSLNS